MQCSGTVQMLIDMELLAHADYLVASDRSKWSKILQYMRYILYGASCTPHACPHMRSGLQELGCWCQRRKLVFSLRSHSAPCKTANMPTQRWFKFKWVQLLPFQPAS